MTLPDPSPLARHWGLDPEVVQLNHGSFGAAPLAVLARQRELRDELEANPTGFFLRRFPELLVEARSALGVFVGAEPDDLALMPNATAGVNTALRSVPLGPGDELLITDHEYPACRNAAAEIAGSTGASLVVAPLPFPVEDPRDLVTAVGDRLTDRTRLLLIDHVTSPTGLVLPVANLAALARERGTTTVVDGAHAPGMVDLDVAALGVDMYAGNCHKWMCAPKGAAFLWVRPDLRDSIRPLVVSHGATAAEDRFRHEFDWTGTADPTPWLCLPTAIEVMASLLPGGWPEVRQSNHDLALDARDILCRTLGVEPPAPDSLLGSMASVPLPGRPDPTGPFAFDPLQDGLASRYRTETPVITWLPGTPRLLRVSAQLYNARAQYEYLAAALGELLGR